MPRDTDLMLSFFDSTDAVMYLKDAQGRFVLVSMRIYVTYTHHTLHQVLT